ncbi:MAG: hypothetical protein RR472_02820 [Anaerovoracaceae bacterium]
MEKSQKAFEEWMTQETLAEDIKIDLARMKDKPEEIHEAFYKDLEFGTSGLRGIMGAGTNRMNRYVVKKVTQGLAEYLLQQEQKPRVAIGYDSRLNSIEFAQCTAGVLVANGIQVYMYRQLMPVAALSYGIRRLGCHMGVMITASHNPKEYNGYKVYGPTGCQILGEAPKEILRACEKVDLFHGVKSLPFAALDGGRGNENFSYIPKEIEEEYVEAAYQCGLDTKGLSKLNIVYTPLNGAGNKPVQEVLRRGGVKNLYLVPEQEEPDGNFETCPLPNPEFQEAYALGVALCKEVSGDFVLATDPDCDREVADAELRFLRVKLVFILREIILVLCCLTIFAQKRSCQKMAWR